MTRTTEIKLDEIALEVEYTLAHDEPPELLHVWYAGEFATFFAADLIDLMAVQGIRKEVFERIREKVLIAARAESLESREQARDMDEELRGI